LKDVLGDGVIESTWITTPAGLSAGSLVGLSSKMMTQVSAGMVPPAPKGAPGSSGSGGGGFFGGGFGGGGSGSW
jgi:hypothetical protein